MATSGFRTVLEVLEEMEVLNTPGGRSRIDVVKRKNLALTPYAATVPVPMPTTPTTASGFFFSVSSARPMPVSWP